MKFRLKDTHRDFKKLLERKLAVYTSRSKFDLIAELSAESGAPVLALMLFLQEIEGSNKELTDNIERVMKQGDITSIEI